MSYTEPNIPSSPPRLTRSPDNFCGAGRGRSPTPRCRLGRPRPFEHSVFPSQRRSFSPDLIFPMSPVLSDEKEAGSTFCKEPAWHSKDERCIVRVDLPLPTPKLTFSRRISPAQHSRRSSNSNPLSRPRKSRAVSPVYHVPSLSQRLAAFLKPTASVMATATEITVHRSSQPDGLSSFVMEEHVPPTQEYVPSQPVRVTLPLRRCHERKRCSHEMGVGQGAKRPHTGMSESGHHKLDDSDPLLPHSSAYGQSDFDPFHFDTFKTNSHSSVSA